MSRNRDYRWLLPSLSIWAVALGLWLVSAARACSAQERPTSYIVIQSVFVASATFDLASTLYYYPRCQPACSEGNWILRPAVEAGPIPTILMAGALTGVTVWAADKLWQHEKIGRHLWWILPVAGTLNHFLAAKANNGVDTMTRCPRFLGFLWRLHDWWVKPSAMGECWLCRRCGKHVHR